MSRSQHNFIDKRHFGDAHQTLPPEISVCVPEVP
jgi:hypothetical protein